MRELAVANPARGRKHVMDLLELEGWKVGARLMKRLWRTEVLLAPPPLPFAAFACAEAPAGTREAIPWTPRSSTLSRGAASP